MNRWGLKKRLKEMNNQLKNKKLNFRRKQVLKKRKRMYRNLLKYKYPKKIKKK